MLSHHLLVLSVSVIPLRPVIGCPVWFSNFTFVFVYWLRDCKVDWVLCKRPLHMYYHMVVSLEDLKYAAPFYANLETLHDGRMRVMHADSALQSNRPSK